jgi:chromate transporter
MPLGNIAIADRLTALIAAGSLAVLFRWRVSNPPLLVAATAVIGLIAFTIFQPTSVLVK